MNTKMYKSRLNRELARHMLSNVGAVPGPDFGKFGIILPHLKIEKTMDFIFDIDGTNTTTIKSPIYAGELTIENAQIRALFVDLSAESDQEEYMLVFRNGTNPIYGVKLLIADSEDDGKFMIMFGEQWQDINITTKCRALIGFETMASHGLGWRPCTQTDDLNLAASTLATLA